MVAAVQVSRFKENPDCPRGGEWFHFIVFFSYLSVVTFLEHPKSPVSQVGASLFCRQALTTSSPRLLGDGQSFPFCNYSPRHELSGEPFCLLFLSLFFTFVICSCVAIFTALNLFFLSGVSYAFNLLLVKSPNLFA